MNKEKRYQVELILTTGNRYSDGTPEIAKSIAVKTNDIEYIIKKQKAHFSDIDIHTGKAYIKDLNGNFDNDYFRW